MLEYHPRYHYTNDFTVIEKDGQYHLFHITGQRLKMSRGLTDLPMQGHAVSTDLVQWRQQPFATTLGGACCAVHHNGRYALVENVRRISWSDDLYAWSDPEPIAFDFDRHADTYETVCDVPRATYNSHRDPNIWRDPDADRYIMFFCSRAPAGDLFTRGCVGAAESTDLVHWRLLPPVFGPGDHFFCESPHVVDLDGKYHLFFTLSPENGLRHAVADRLLGPYTEVEGHDVLPAYVTASEAVKVGDQWKFLGRLEDRNERSNQTRVAPRAICLPLDLATGPGDRIRFRACDALTGLRGACRFDTARDPLADRWRVESGDWRINTTVGLAANQHETIPANSLFGTSSCTPARVVMDVPVHHVDVEFDLQWPTFNGNDCQLRGGWVLDGVTFVVDTFQKALFCQDHHRDIVAFKPLPLVKADRYYHVRVFRCAGITQVYMDGDLLMYVPAYGNGTGEVGFAVDHSDLVVTNIRVWELDVPEPAGFALDDPDGAIMNGITM